MSKVKYNAEATVELNLYSTTKALRDMSLLLKTSPLMQIDFTVDALEKLADRIEEIYEEQNEKRSS